MRVLCYFACYLFFRARKASQTQGQAKKSSRKRQYDWLNMVLVACFLVAIPIAVSYIGNEIMHLKATDERGGVMSSFDDAAENQADYLTGLDFMASGREYVEAIDIDFALKSLIYTPVENTVNNPIIRGMWGGVVLGANSIIVFLFAIYGFRIMLGATGLRYAEAIETLPRIVLAIIGANISIAFVTFILMLGNALSIGIYGLSQDQIGEASDGLLEAIGGSLIGSEDELTTEFGLDEVFDNLIAALIQTLLGPIFIFVLKPFFDILEGIPSWVPGLGDIEVPDAWQEFALITTILNIVTLVLMFLIVIQAIVRLALLNMLTVISPLGFIAWALPNGMGNGMFRFWLNATVSTAFTQFLQLTCYVGGMAFFQGLDFLDGAMILGGISPEAIGRIAALWLVMRVPGWLQNSVTSTMGQASQNVLAVTNQMIMAAQSAIQTAVTAIR